MKTIAFDDHQIAALNALRAGPNQPEHRAFLTSALATAGWRDPCNVPAQYHSTPTEAILVLVCGPLRNDQVLGYYSPAQGWRVLGAPPALPVRAWMPMPDQPAGVLPWET